MSGYRAPLIVTSRECVFEARLSNPNILPAIKKGEVHQNVPDEFKEVFSDNRMVWTFVCINYH
jgi:hypothetical protein